MNNPSFLDKLKTLAEAATPGPWDYYIETGMEGHGIVITYTQELDGPRSPGKAVFPRREPTLELDKIFVASANPKTILTLLNIIQIQRESLEDIKFLAYASSQEPQGHRIGRETSEYWRGYQEASDDISTEVTEALERTDALIKGLE